MITAMQDLVCGVLLIQILCIKIFDSYNYHGTKMFPETAWKSKVSPNCCEIVPGFFQSVPEYLKIVPGCVKSVPGWVRFSKVSPRESRQKMLHFRCMVLLWFYHGFTVVVSWEYHGKRYFYHSGTKVSLVMFRVNTKLQYLLK